MLCTFDLRILVTIMVDDVPTAMHHLTELEGLLGEGAGAIVLACDCMGYTENMKAERRSGGWFGKGCIPFSPSIYNADVTPMLGVRSSC